MLLNLRKIIVQLSIKKDKAEQIVYIAPEKALFTAKKYYFSYMCMKAYVVGTH